jgi:hypothetical protein
MDIVAKEGGDEHILEAFNRLSQSIYSVLSEDYGKHAKSMLLQTINKITAVCIIYLF